MKNSLELKIKLATQARYTHKVFDIIEELLDIVVLDKDKRHEFIIALGEALDNAITHGNKLDQNKFIEIECLVTRNQITCSVQDEGPGFNYKPYLNQTLADFDLLKFIEKVRKGQICGLGLALIRKCSDEVYFNETGNKIYFVKRLIPT